MDMVINIMLILAAAILLSGAFWPDDGP